MESSKNTPLCFDIYSLTELTDNDVLLLLQGDYRNAYIGIQMVLQKPFQSFCDTQEELDRFLFSCSVKTATEYFQKLNIPMVLQNPNRIHTLIEIIDQTVKEINQGIQEKNKEKIKMHLERLILIISNIDNFQ